MDNTTNITIEDFKLPQSSINWAPSHNTHILDPVQSVMKTMSWQDGAA